MAGLSRIGVRDRTIEIAARTWRGRLVSAPTLTDDALFERLERCDLVTLDVFDTVLVRPLAQPDHAFAFLGGEQRRRIRVQAEHEARVIASRSNREEVTLGEIHDVACRLDATWDAAGQAASEIDIEHELCRPHEPAARLLARLDDAGVRVVFITDTYLTAATVRSLLGGLADGRSILASSDVGVTKRSGRLFDAAAAELGIDASRWFHVGDTLVPDVVRPAVRGIGAGYVSRPIDQFRRTVSRADLLTAPSDEHCGSVVMGSLANELAGAEERGSCTATHVVDDLATRLVEHAAGASPTAPVDSVDRAIRRILEVVSCFGREPHLAAYAAELRRLTTGPS